MNRGVWGQTTCPFCIGARVGCLWTLVVVFAVAVVIHCVVKEAQ